MKQRPFILDPLFRSINILPGIGPSSQKRIEKLIGGGKILDLLFHAPVDFIDRRFTPQIADAPNNRIATLQIKVEKHIPNSRKSLPYRVKVIDDSGSMDLVFFHAKSPWIEKSLPLGETRIISGKVEYFHGKAQMVHPDFIGSVEEKADIQTIEPIYPLTQGITNKVLRKAMLSALKLTSAFPEWLDTAHLTKTKWPDWKTAIHKLHNPESEKDLDLLAAQRSRLAYDELLANQITIALIRRNQIMVSGRSFKPSVNLHNLIVKNLPFELTGAQKRSLKEINEDMASNRRMLRLLQGDVGSGKTIVACLAAMNAIENGAQAAILAPTEILARQHAESMREWLQAASVRYVILTGRDKGKKRETLVSQIKNGAAQLIIGTHAIFQDDIKYHDLGLAIIDEQHRFGVHQRMSLSGKGEKADILVMTATPIPRTLSLTNYGDLEISKLDEKPPGRKPVETLLIPKEKIEDLISGLKRKIDEGNRVYWVCPLVEESEVMDIEAAEERYDVLKSIFPNRTGLVHGRMKAEEKEAVMQKFSNGDLDILVATTVIEVGVNVPEATIMVIEHAERFGLSQLHQLRGRVGRGADQSYCFLLYAGPLGETAKERLSIMRDTEDGFIIAEKDLELRGSGDILGTKQSGEAHFKIADLAVHRDLLATAHNDARLLIEKDPNLTSERGEKIKTLLYMFERDQAIKYLKSG
ncbi:MAG: ATP-dependent DNA helicase RecG [Alphaproteobacteria bacterium]|nr:ATP-dependent DNA helicase RecG [Alphaproteobacteria bacterium]